MELRILSVNVGRGKIIGLRGDEPVLSAFGKKPVEARDVRIGLLGIDGDEQVDLRVHGGPDKAVYVYSVVNWPWWESEKRIACRAGSFGENLTLDGADEADVRIGDRFRWDNVLLEVSQPRQPCFKFQLFSGREDAGALMTLSGRCGWYFRVLHEDAARAGGTVLTRVLASNGPSVRETFFAAFNPRLPDPHKQRIADTRALSLAWREKLVRAGTKIE